MSISKCNLCQCNYYGKNHTCPDGYITPTRIARNKGYSPKYGLELAKKMFPGITYKRKGKTGGYYLSSKQAKLLSNRLPKK